jgi:hypothetical protein
MSTGKPSIGMGILSWRGAASLDYALGSYSASGLFNLFGERAIILPEPDEAVKSIAAQHPLTSYEFDRNLGIAGGMRAVAETLSTDYVLFLENDCPLIESYEAAEKQIAQSIEALEAGAAFMARLRSRREPGELFNTLEKYQNYWADGLKPTIRRTLRPLKAKRLCGTAVYARSDPHLKHPNYISRYDDDSYIVSPKAMPWTNQSILLRRRDFLDVILPFVESQALTRAINGFHNIEIELNQSRFWTGSDMNIFCPPGIFTHKRLGDRGYL